MNPFRTCTDFVECITRVRTCSAPINAVPKRLLANVPLGNDLLYLDK
jgi:hypothetical protein